jgi:hypothetical protein
MTENPVDIYFSSIKRVTRGGLRNVSIQMVIKWEIGKVFLYHIAIMI